MSATQTQPTPDKTKADSLRLLQSFADTANLDLNTCSEQMFRVSPDYLTKPQRLELLRMLLKAQPKTERHYHPCFDCGESVGCERTDCDRTEGQCRPCHEG